MKNFKKQSFTITLNIHFDGCHEQNMMKTKLSKNKGILKVNTELERI